MHHHLTLEEREVIAQMLSADRTQAEIARQLDRDPSTISRELRRNRSRNGYWAVAAERKAQRRRSQRPWVSCCVPAHLYRSIITHTRNGMRLSQSRLPPLSIGP
jgi:IS30 family transposase